MRIALLVALVACSCSGLPVRYERCDSQGADCELVARFDTTESCEFFRRYQNAACTVDRSGVATCQFEQSALSSGRCKK